MRYSVKLLSPIMIVGSAWLMGAWFNLYWFQDPSWIRAIYTQKAKIADHVKSPHRILMVGGSATHFGVEAKQIEQSLGIPVINFGLHAGLGLDTILSLAQKQIQRGDIVVVSPEPEILEPKNADNTRFLSALFELKSGYLGTVESDPQNLINRLIVVGSPGFTPIAQAVQSQIFQSKEGKLQAYNFQTTLHGDAIELPRGKPRPSAMHSIASSPALHRLAAFRRVTQEKQATLLLTLPWRLSDLDAKSVESAQTIIYRLSEIAPVLYEPKSLNLKTDPTLFGDSIYHLSPQGRRLRSQELIDQLRPMILNPKE